MRFVDCVQTGLDVGVTRIERHAQRGEEGLDIQWLAQESEERRMGTFRDGRGSADQENRDSRLNRVNAGGQLKAVQPGHDEIRQDRGIRRRLRILQGGMGAIRSVDVHVLEGLHHELAEHTNGQRVIIDDKDSEHAGAECK